MALVTNTDAAAALWTMIDYALIRGSVIHSENEAPEIESDDDQDSESPVFYSLYSTVG